MARTTPVYNFTINQGATFSTPLTWKDANNNPIDVTGYSAKLIARLNTVDDPVLLEMSDVNSRIVVGTTDGRFTLQMTAAETAALDFDKAKYQMEITSGSGEVTRLLSGVVTLSDELVV